MVAFACLELRGREPVQLHDLLVELALPVGFANLAGEAEAQEGHVLSRVVPAIDADERARLKAMRCFFEHFAAACGDERLAGIEVAGGLVEHKPPVDALFDEKEPPAALDYCGDGDTRSPDRHNVRLRLRPLCGCSSG